MLLGYVSDEMYVAIAGALVELRQGDVSIEARSRASGAIHAEVGPGAWEVILSHPGHTRKTVQVEFTEKPHQFRLMSDRLLGYMWPKWIEAGGRGQIRLHATRPADSACGGMAAAGHPSVAPCATSPSPRGAASRSCPTATSRSPELAGTSMATRSPRTGASS